jgi:hypothetical protein
LGRGQLAISRQRGFPARKRACGIIIGGWPAECANFAETQARIVLPMMIMTGADNDMSITTIGTVPPIIIILLAAVAGKNYAPPSSRRH